MADTPLNDLNAEAPAGEVKDQGNSEFESAWTELSDKEKAGADAPPDPEIEKLDRKPEDNEQGSSDAPPVSDAPPAQAGADEDQPDPWKDAPEHLRALHEQKIARRDQTIRSNSGRLKAIS